MLLIRACAGVLVLLALVAVSPAAAQSGGTLTHSVQKGIDYLMPDTVQFSRSNSCQACHRQGAALFGAATAKAGGYTVDTSDANGLGYLAWHAVRDQESTGRWTHGGSFNNSKTSYAFFGLAGYDQLVATRYSQQLVKAAEWSLSQQQSDGKWREDHGSMPTTYGDVPVTARMMMGIAQAKHRVDSVTTARYTDALTRAASWLRLNRASANTEIMRYNFQISYALLGLDAAGSTNTDADIQFLQNRLLGATVGGGGPGWGYSIGHGADEYNTGLALYALCRTGKSLRDDSRIQAAANWLRNRQAAGGYWQSSSFATRDIPTTFAILGLSCFGELGVDIDVEGETRQIINAHDTQAQTASFTLTVKNLGAFDFTDTYALSVQGGLPGWSTSVEPSSLTLASGSNAAAILTVTAPPNLPEALPVEFTVTARSQTNTSITSSVTVTVLTNPPPPTTGHATAVAITEGAHAIITSRLSAQPLAARVTDTVTGKLITGPGRGVVTFHVAGSAVGTDTDEDGDGIYRITWVPGLSWTATGEQDFRAIYSGIDLPAPQNDLLPSLMASTLTISPVTDSDGDGLSDDQEAELGTDPTNPDTDGDGLLDGDEVTRGSDPLNPNTDGDGYNDGVEVGAGSNPLDPNSIPAPRPTIWLTSPWSGRTYTPDQAGGGAGSFAVLLEGGTAHPCNCVVEVREGDTVYARFNSNGGAWSQNVRLPLGSHSLTVTATNYMGMDLSKTTVIGVPNAPDILSKPPALIDASQSTLAWTLQTVPGAVVDVTFNDNNGSGEITAGTFTANSNGIVQVVLNRPYDCKPTYRFYPRIPGQPGQGQPASSGPFVIDTTAPVFTCLPEALREPWKEQPTEFKVAANDGGSGIAGYLWRVVYPGGTVKEFSGQSWSERLMPGLHRVSVMVMDIAGNSTSQEVEVEILQHVTTLGLNDMVMPHGDPVTMVGYLFDDTASTPMKGTPLRYFIDGQPVDSIVDLVVSLPPGSYPVRVVYEGNALYTPSEATATLTLVEVCR